MQRQHLAFLSKWLKGKTRKPLVIRGARQVGKTWLVRKFTEEAGLQCVELNLEKRPQVAAFFSSNDPKQILLNLSTLFGQTIDPARCLLFLDEIQAAPELLAKLRWFAEDLPELPVIAAGSLLEFVLAKHTFSMPVGRINYLHLEPISFEEFLVTTGRQSLSHYLSVYEWGMELPLEIHNQCMSALKEYIIVGGMPAAVFAWINNHSWQEVNQVHHELIATYREDFTKYSGRLPIERLDDTMMSIPRQLGEKFIYSDVNPDVEGQVIKKSLNLLCQARVGYKVMGSSANGVPLGAEERIKHLKVIFLDVGMCSAALGLALHHFLPSDGAILINKGAIAEQLAGQMLRSIEPPYIAPALYYWRREEKGSSAEVDYVIQHQNLVVPMEIKAGSTGSLKSLHLFMGLKKFPIGVRINVDLPSQMEVKMHDSLGNLVHYRLVSLPFYLLGQLHRLIA